MWLLRPLPVLKPCSTSTTPKIGNSNLLQYSCLQNSMDRETWWASVHGLDWSCRVGHDWACTLACYYSTWGNSSVQFRSVQSLSRVWPFAPHELQHARPPCPSPTPGVHSNSCASSWWCHPAISSSVIPFSSFPQSFPASESFPMSQLFAWGGQNIGVSASASVLPMNIQDWFPLG